MKELDLIYQASEQMRVLRLDVAPIKSVNLNQHTFEAISYELSKEMTYRPMIQNLTLNNYFIYKGITYYKETTK